MDGEWLWWIIILGVGALFIFWPQWQARKRQQKRFAELTAGDRVVTIGGFCGTLKYFNPEEDKALVELAEGVVVEILPAAISRKLDTSTPFTTSEA